MTHPTEADLQQQIRESLRAPRGGGAADLATLTATVEKLTAQLKAERAECARLKALLDRVT